MECRNQMLDMENSPIKKVDWLYVKRFTERLEKKRILASVPHRIPVFIFRKHFEQ